MIDEVIYAARRDGFEDRTFSAWEWTAPTVASPRELREWLDSFRLPGRQVQRLELIGECCSLTRYWLEEEAYDQLGALPEAERRRCASYPNFHGRMSFARSCLTGDPLIVEFEDGDALALFTPEEGKFRMSLDRTHWWIKGEISSANADANILFSPWVGQKILKAEVNTYVTDRDPQLQEAFAEPPSQQELAADITIWFANGVGLRLGGFVDSCRIRCIDQTGEDLPIPFAELEPALFNWEDLHWDEVTGFKAESDTLFFGSKGEEHIDIGYMTLSPAGETEAEALISVDDFRLLGWSMDHITEEGFDRYGRFTFTREEWRAILAEAERILAIETFDEVFEDFAGWNILYQSGANAMIIQLNYHGGEFWQDRDKYRIQIRDLQVWTELALGPDGVLYVYGF